MAVFALNTILAEIEVTFFCTGIVAGIGRVEALSTTVASENLALLNDLSLGGDPGLRLVTLELDHLVSIIACQMLLSIEQSTQHRLIRLLGLSTRGWSLRLCALEAVVEITVLFTCEVTMGEIDLLSARVTEEVRTVGHSTIYHHPLLRKFLEVHLVHLVTSFGCHWLLIRAEEMTNLITGRFFPFSLLILW